MPPEYLAGILLAFVQLRLRSYFGLATWLLNDLTFFLPPEDALIATLNGQPTPTISNGRKLPPPLSAAEKMDKLYVRVAKTEPGVFHQTLFFELYEMLIVLVSSASLGCWIGSLFGFAVPWVSPTHATHSMEMATYGLMSALLVALWFPLQLNCALGWQSYEARVGLAGGFIGFVLAACVLCSPPGWFGFELASALQLVMKRVAMVLRTVGLTDADFVHMAPLAELTRVALLFSFSLVAGIFTCTSFLPSFRFARMYADLVQDQHIKSIMKLLLHLNMVLPVLVCVLWVPRLSSALLVPSALAKCSPRALTRDCLPSGVPITTWTWYSLPESHFYTLRLYVVFLAGLVRLMCFRTYVQRFLLEPRAVMASLVGQPGRVDGQLLQNKVRLQFNYVPIIALQYLAPVCALVAAAQLGMYQTATSLGIAKGLVWVLQRLAPNMVLPATLTWESLDAASLNVLPDPSARPDLGGFRLGEELTKANVFPFLRGMSQYPVVTPEFYDAALGFVIWFMSFSMTAVSVAGLLYWRITAAHTTTNIQAPLRQNKQTPKKLKNQLKSLKLTKKNQ